MSDKADLKIHAGIYSLTNNSYSDTEKRAVALEAALEIIKASVTSGDSTSSTLEKKMGMLNTMTNQILEALNNG